MNTEQWKPVVGFETYYEVSSLGRIRRIKAGMGARVGRILRTYLDSDGYECVRLSSPASRSTVTVHRIVASAFIGVPDAGMEACHIDGSRANNVASNLKWGSHADNIRDTLRHGTHNQASKTHCAAGHEFNALNTRHYNGRRACRACARAATAKYKAARRAA